MEISNLFKNALYYPLGDFKKLILLGIISVISSISAIYVSFGGYDLSIYGILYVIGLIISLIIAGYLISIIKVSISGSNIIPNFSLLENFVMGIKYIILNIVYFIIPVIIVLLIAWATGFFDASSQILSNLNSTSLATFNAADSNALMSMFSSSIPNTVIDTFVTSSIISTIVAVILVIVFGLLLIIGECRLAETNSLAEGLKIKEVFNDISRIGFDNFIIWFVVWIIILIILTLIITFVMIIPFIGVIIAAIIISPFITMFTARAMGLMYSNK